MRLGQHPVMRLGKRQAMRPGVHQTLCVAATCKVPVPGRYAMSYLAVKPGVSQT